MVARPRTAKAAATPAGGGGERWDESNRRVTFYCPVEVLEAIEAEMKRSGRSKSQVIVNALRAYLET